MYENKVRDLVLASIVADAYCLGSHWVYDENDLKNLKVNWEELNNPHALWHKGKVAGDFTHYGDQTHFFYNYAKDKEVFDVADYLKEWSFKMTSYDGYVDGATRETLANLENQEESPFGSTSNDLSIVSRIVPLLLLSSSKEEFLSNVEAFVSATHNSTLCKDASKYFALVLLDVLEGSDILESFTKHKESFSSNFQGYVEEGIASKHGATFDVIREFGPACGTDEGFPGLIHILAKYDNFEDAMIFNAKAGGDNSARAMIIAALFAAKDGIKNIPKAWLQTKLLV